MECALPQHGYFSENDFHLCCKVCIIIHRTAGSWVDGTPWEEGWRGLVLRHVSEGHISVRSLSIQGSHAIGSGPGLLPVGLSWGSLVILSKLQFMNLINFYKFIYKIRLIY